MKGHDPTGQTGPSKPLPDSVQIFEPPAEKVISEPISEAREQPAPVTAPPAEEAYAQQPEAYAEEQVF